MIVIADTTPLISLLKINRLDLLEVLFSRVLIPEAVFDELTADKRFSAEADQIRKAEYIEAKSVADIDAVSALRQTSGLDLGESEAIVLADELSADILLMDEAKGRHVSAQKGIAVIGTIGILMAAHEEDILTDTETLTCINGLKLAKRHIGQQHYQMLLERLNL